MEVAENASPSSSPPEAKRKKLAERDSRGYHTFDRNNEVARKYQEYYTVRLTSILAILYSRTSSGSQKTDFVCFFAIFLVFKPIVGAEDIEKFMNLLFTELPGTFRVCGGREDVMKIVNAQIEALAKELGSTSEGGSTETPILSRLEWYPGGMGWQVHVPRQDMKKSDSELVNKLKQFLISETAVGHIARQEAVSMIPPLFMDIKEYHRVLDMCASPGSKTGQLLEALHTDAFEDFNPSAPNPPIVDGKPYKRLVRGLVHANDANVKRINTLISQTKRLNSPSLFITHHDAQVLPILEYLPEGDLIDRYHTLYSGNRLALSPLTVLGVEQNSEDASNSEKADPLTAEKATSSTAPNREKQSAPKPLTQKVPLVYDRILCDVPCSGDGTSRKNTDMWLKWKPTSGHGLHSVQTNILLRAVQLAAPNARIVYSTCSLNPVEDEAVILETIRRCPKKLRLVDVSGVLPKLRYRPGLHTWTCSDDDGNAYSKFEDVPEEWQKKLYKSAFPPSDPEEAKRHHIERCMRFLPHDQNTGGFFVAVLEVCDASGEFENFESSAPTTPSDETNGNGKDENGSEKEEKDNNDATSVVTRPKETPKVPKRSKYRKPQPADFEKLEEGVLFPIYDKLKAFFELSDDLPIDQLVKHANGFHKLYLVSRAAALLLDHDYLHRLRVKTVGVRVFESSSNAQGSPCEYRLTQDGIAAMYPFLGPKRLVNVTAHDLKLLFTAKDPVFDDFAPATREKLVQMELGSVAFSYFAPMGPSLPPHHILLVGWRGKVSTHILVKPNEIPSFVAAFEARHSD